MLKLMGKISVVIVIALLLSVGVDIIYRRIYNYSYHWSKNFLPLPEIAEKYDIVRLGNSHADEGITFEYFKLKPLYLSSVAQSFDYDLAMLKMYGKQIQKGAIIIINISPVSFSQKKPGKEDYVNTNYYDGRLSPFLIPQFKLDYYVEFSLVPFIRTGYLWRDAYAKEVKERTTMIYAAAWKKEEKIPQKTPPSTINSTATDTNIINTTSADRDSTNTTKTVPDSINTQKPNVKKTDDLDLSTMPQESQDKLARSVDFLIEKWYRSGDFGIQYSEANSIDLAKLIDYCVKMKWRPILITIPISQISLDRLEQNYMQIYVYGPLAKTNLYGAPYFDFSTNKQFIRNGAFFNDADHLNKNGAKILSHMLIKRLIARGYVTEEVDGYK